MAEYEENDILLEGEDEDIEIGKGSPPWMTTYSDLVTQLLIFFVMMFALAATLNEMQLLQVKRRLETYADQNQLEEVIVLEIDTRGLVISLSEKLMFDSGKADIYEEAKDILADISEEIIDIPNDIRVEGHTDSVPIRTAEFASNWELSATRATNITRFLTEQLDFPPGRLSAGGYSKYHPAVETEFNEEISRYKQRVKDVPHEFSEEIVEAGTPEEEEMVIRKIRHRQLSLQREMQEVIQRHLVAANRTAEQRAMNRRVDLIVQRLSTAVEETIEEAL